MTLRGTAYFGQRACVCGHSGSVHHEDAGVRLERHTHMWCMKFNQNNE
jgi:hypothetical protein